MTTIDRPMPVGYGSTWPKVVAAFLAGAVFATFCAIRITPRDADGQRVSSTGGMAAGDEIFVEEGAGESLDGAAATASAGSSGGSRVVRSGGGGTTGGTRRSGTGAEGAEGTAGRTGGSSGSGSAVGGGASGTSGGSGAGGAGGATGPAECAAGKNGGATDKGVTATQIKLAATVVKDGAGKSLLESSEIGMRAVINKVNAEGGICGRRLALTTVNDSWDAARGQEYIRRFIDEGYFALPVVPSSEGLSEAIKGNLIAEAGIPVVGANGLRVDQYSDDWVFPVGTATVSIMRAMVDHAYKQGKRNFGIVWDEKYKFGQEGAEAFRKYVTSLPDATVKADQKLNPDVQGYGTEAQNFNRACGNSGETSGCDLVVLLLVPSTALNWKAANPGAVAGRGAVTYGAQTLFTDDFARQCGSWCSGMAVWTGYNPPIPPVDSKPGVAQYVNDVKAISPSVDTRNQFLQGAYLGMQVFVQAVKDCSPVLTRACIREKLDATDFSTDLASSLSWRPKDHYANKYAQPFAIDATGGTFNGWKYLQDVGFVRDPKL